ncbi:GNAT family N-acetyltransferase [Shewanella waksmanii]|uniref:GNAT family N-acetyltransferase n=1 Tax=Shewanella waksmanii TaxID=213783 RepID=UPI00048B817B|nr:GNAT family N-acetyltransferase [Shewanella waksmanii]
MFFRIAIDEDLKLLAPLFDDYRCSLGQPSHPELSQQFISARLSENDSVIFLAFVEQQLVGFIQLYPSFSFLLLKPLWYFDDLYVDPGFRGQGIAKQLIAKAKELADETQVLAVRRDKLNSPGFLPIEIDSLDEVLCAVS